MTLPRAKPQRRRRRGAILLMAAMLAVVMLAMIAFAVDVGGIVLVRSQLQNAADSSAMAAAATMRLARSEMEAVAREFAGYHVAGGTKVDLVSDDIEYGIWDVSTRTFTPIKTPGNAVRVTARTDEDVNGRSPLFFARIFGGMDFAQRASAVAMANPRDIAFVVDLSGSMNDDTEPCWATAEINDEFADEGYPTIGNDLMEDLFKDFGFGKYPGTLQYIGEPAGVAKDKWAYAELTKDGGPLANLPDEPKWAKYRILPGDNELVRKVKGYSAIIDFQIAKVMPKAKPVPSSALNYAYWEKYLDYIIRPVRIVPPPPPRPPSPPSPSPSPSPPPPSPSPSPSPPPPPPPPKPPLGWLRPGPDASWLALWMEDPRNRRASPSAGRRLGFEVALAPGGADAALLASMMPAATTPGTPPEDRGWLPPRQDGDRITGFNNPNRSVYPSASSRAPRAFRNWIGYVTYVQFMLDHGRDLKPEGTQYVPLSRHSPHCPWNTEQTAGGNFSFPPRTQPMHAARRALIAAIQIVKERNAMVPDINARDWVSVIAFDTLKGGGPVIEQPLTGDYDAAMLACTGLQAVGDKGATTSTEDGLATAREHIRPAAEGGQGRVATNKIVVLLTDGVPNLYSSDPADVDEFIANSDQSEEFYNTGEYWKDAPLMQTAQMQADGWYVYPVGVGLGTDYGFMDRMARLGETANDDGQSSRGSGNPAEYEQRLVEIFEEIIDCPKVRLVQ